MTEVENVGTAQGGLLAMLMVKGLIRQPEVTVTSSIAWLCQRPGGATALRDLIKKSAGGLLQADNATWLAEVVAADRTRTDLECWWGDPRGPRVVMEAKLDARLTAEQIAGYIVDQRRRLISEPGDALLLVLVPAHRRSEAESVLPQAVALAERLWAAEPAQGVPEAPVAPGRRHVDVWTYDQILAALAGPGADPDLDQLRGLIGACEALDIRPFTAGELGAPSALRRGDLIKVLDRATARVKSPRGRLYPSGWTDAGFEWRRYIEIGQDGTNIAVGLRRQDADTPSSRPSATWLRLSRETNFAERSGQRLRLAFPKTAKTDAYGDCWLPLAVPTEVGGSAMVDALVAQITQASEVITADTLGVVIA